MGQVLEASQKWTLDSEPGERMCYRRNSTSLWQCVTNGSLHWVCAELINEHYTNHRKYDTLQEAIEAEG